MERPGFILEGAAPVQYLLVNQEPLVRAAPSEATSRDLWEEYVGSYERNGKTLTVRLGEDHLCYDYDAVTAARCVPAGRDRRVFDCSGRSKTLASGFDRGEPHQQSNADGKGPQAPFSGQNLTKTRDFWAFCQLLTHSKGLTIQILTEGRSKTPISGHRERVRGSARRAAATTTFVLWLVGLLIG